MLGQETTLDDASEFLRKINKEYPTRELSPIWLGISRKANAFVVQFEKPPYVSDEDRDKLLKLVSKFPNDPYVNYGLFLLGDYDKIITSNTGPNTEWLDFAYYYKAESTFDRKDYSNAVKYYIDFLHMFSNHRWTDDATYKAGVSYALNGNFQEFLNWMQKVKLLPETYLQQNVKYEVFKQLIGIPSAELSALRNAKNDDEINETIEYILAEQLLVERDYDRALQQFQQVCSNTRDRGILRMCPENIGNINEVIQIRNSNTDDMLYRLAIYFRGKKSLFWNDIFRDDYSTMADSVGIDFYLERNNYASAIQLLNQFIEQHPQSP